MIKYFKNKDFKILLSNFSYLTILQVLGYVFTLITIPYLSLVIGVEGYGKIAFAFSIIVYFQTFVDWGFNYTAVRDIAKNKENMEIVCEIFSNVITSKLILMMIATIVFTLITYLVPFMYTYRLILWCTFLLIPGYIMFPDWLFQGLEHMKYITIMSLVSRTIFTVLVFTLINKKSDYYLQPLLLSISMILSGVFALLYANKYFKIRFIIPNLKDVKNTIVKSANMFVSLFLPNLYSNFSVILLGICGGEVASGIYSAGSKFSGLCDQFSQVISRTFFPFLARKIEKHIIYVRISGGLSLLMSLTLFLASDLLIDLFYTEDFEDAKVVVRILSLSPIFLFLSNTYGTNYLILKGYDNVVRNITACCSILGFCLSILCVVNWSYIGVAITMVSVRGLMGLLTWIYSKRY